MTDLVETAPISTLPETQRTTSLDLGFHRRMAYACLALIGLSFAGCVLTSIDTSVSVRVTAVLLLLAMVLPIPAYWQDKGQLGRRDAALTIPWAVLLAATLSFPLLIAARLRMPLEDAFFARADSVFGVNVATVSGWAQHHVVGIAITSTYNLLTPLLAVAIFLPALAGKLRSARMFLLANLIGFAIATPLFALLPAVGPWYHFHLAPAPDQAYCEAQLLALRQPGPYFFASQGAGVVCFPSFHVIWAILCAAALWGFKPLRVPVCLLSGLIILSTLTTGWHYFSDGLAGAVIAAISLWFAFWLMRDPITAGGG